MLAERGKHEDDSLHDVHQNSTVDSASVSAKPTIKAANHIDVVQPASAKDSSVKKSRGMAKGAVLKPGTLPGVKPKRK